MPTAPKKINPNQNVNKFHGVLYGIIEKIRVVIKTKAHINRRNVLFF
jgi:hypothetical protein